MGIRQRVFVGFALLTFGAYLLYHTLYAMLKLESKGPAAASAREYPIGVPDKFTPDGQVQHFPGNTIVCHLPNSSDVYGSLLALHEKLATSPLSSLYTLLPPSSWHMTVFEGVNDQVRNGHNWPGDLPVDRTIEECTALFEKKLSTFNLQCEPPYQLLVTGFDPLQKEGIWYGIGLTLVGRSTEELARIKGLRDRLAVTLRVRKPGHDNYGLHLSMAYLIRKLTVEQERDLIGLLMGHFEDMPKEIELGAPEFCTFEDMFAFKPLLYLKSQ